MLTGDPSLRTGGDVNINVCHRCNDGTSNGIPCQKGDTWAFPPKPCPRGIRSNLIFPSCWDGKNLDSPDHKSHMAHGGVGGFSHTTCPASHPIRMPQVCFLLRRSG